MAPSGPSTSIVSIALFAREPQLTAGHAATSTYLLTGSADNTMKLWRVQTGECLKTWEFPTAVKRVQFSEDDGRMLCVTEQRMGHKGAIRIFDVKTEGERALGLVQVGEPGK
jgi:WD40 repeat protein